MQREHLQDRRIICRYHPTESGDYVISVKWSGEHVYGSPFHTHIFESQEELDQFQHELV
jgi:filamin